jgi:hypothetical protein
MTDKKEIIKRVSNQLSNNRGERRDTSADVGGQFEQAAWVLAQGDGPTTWLRDEEAMRGKAIGLHPGKAQHPSGRRGAAVAN